LGGAYRIINIKTLVAEGFETRSVKGDQTTSVSPEDVVDCIDLRMYAKRRNPDIGFFELAQLIDIARRNGDCR
jgi:hypothetical protein